MIINGKLLLNAAPIKDMVPEKVREYGVSHGLSEVGYDIRIKQTVKWTPPNPYQALTIFENRVMIMANNDAYYFDDIFLKAFHGYTEVIDGDKTKVTIGRTAIASSVEEFDMPPHLWCKFSNKSTYARIFVDATNGTDAEPGWKGFLTIELIFHALEPVLIPGGSGLLKGVFKEIYEPKEYQGKYQNQPDRPVEAIFEKT